MAKEIVWYSVLMQGDDETPMDLVHTGICYTVAEDGVEIQKTLEHEPEDWKTMAVDVLVAALIQAAKDAEGIT